MRKNSLTLMLLTGLLLSMTTGCGGESATDETSVSTEPAIKAYEEQMETSATEDSTEATDASENKTEATESTADPDADEAPDESYDLCPDVEVNVDETFDLGCVNINDVECHITADMTLEELLTATGTEPQVSGNVYGSTYIEKESFWMTGVMFGIAGEPDASLEGTITINGETFNMNELPTFGTTYTAEVLDATGEVVDEDTFDQTKMGEYTLKGIEISDFFIEEDFDVIFYGGLHTGMTEFELFDSYGEGQFLGEDTFGNVERGYNNGTHTIVTILEYDDEKETMVVDSIVLLIND